MKSSTVVMKNFSSENRRERQGIRRKREPAVKDGCTVHTINIISQGKYFVNFLSRFLCR